MSTDVVNKFGETPLHMCCGQNNGKLDLARVLVMRGANFQSKNALGDSPLDLAKRYGHHEITMLFNSASGSVASTATQGNSSFISDGLILGS
jgi:ankyrin repeat protein